MKKNILSILILALLIVNIVLTSIMMFSVMGGGKENNAIGNRYCFGAEAGNPWGRWGSCNGSYGADGSV